MSYLPEPYPSNGARQPAGGPAFSTTVNTTLIGNEQRNQNWVRSRHSYEESQGIKTAEDFTAVGAHFRMARGKLHHYRKRDWADYQAEREEGGATAITSTTFQLVKRYGAEVGFIEERRITRPSAGTLSVWISGVLQTLTTHYAVDIETGILTIPAAPDADDIECAFEFDVPCRYDTDELKAVLVELDPDGPSLMSWESIPIVEVRE